MFDAIIDFVCGEFSSVCEKPRVRRYWYRWIDAPWNKELKRFCCCYQSTALQTNICSKIIKCAKETVMDHIENGFLLFVSFQSLNFQLYVDPICYATHTWIERIVWAVWQIIMESIRFMYASSFVWFWWPLRGHCRLMIPFTWFTAKRRELEEIRKTTKLHSILNFCVGIKNWPDFVPGFRYRRWLEAKMKKRNKYLKFLLLIIPVQVALCLPTKPLHSSAWHRIRFAPHDDDNRAKRKYCSGKRYRWLVSGIASARLRQPHRLFHFFIVLCMLLLACLLAPCLPARTNRKAIILLNLCECNKSFCHLRECFCVCSPVFLLFFFFIFFFTSWCCVFASARAHFIGEDERMIVAVLFFFFVCCKIEHAEHLHSIGKCGEAKQRNLSCSCAFPIAIYAFMLRYYCDIISIVLRFQTHIVLSGELNVVVVVVVGVYSCRWWVEHALALLLWPYSGVSVHVSCTSASIAVPNGNVRDRQATTTSRRHLVGIKTTTTHLLASLMQLRCHPSTSTRSPPANNRSWLT